MPVMFFAFSFCPKKPNPAVTESPRKTTDGCGSAAAAGRRPGSIPEQCNQQAQGCSCDCGFVRCAVCHDRIPSPPVRAWAECRKPSLGFLGDAVVGAGFR